jgi:MFS family permease
MGSLNVMPSYTSYFTLTTTTKSLNTAISYMGGATCALFAGPAVDWRGRKECIFWSAVITLIGGVIQGAAQNIGMFIAGRFIVGLGLGLAQVSTPTLVAETSPVKWRGFALGLYYACWGVGTLLASGVCYGVSRIPYCCTQIQESVY